MNLKFAVLVGLAITMTVAGCSTKPQVDFGPSTIAAVTPSAECETAGVTALASVEAMHDRENAFYARIDADGTETDAELAEAAKIEAQADIDFGNAIQPTFSVCRTAGEWIGLMRATPAIMESTTPEAITDQTLQNYCGYYASAPVCLDAVKRGIKTPTVTR